MTLLATAFLVCSTLLTFPNYISFFNELIEPPLTVVLVPGGFRPGLGQDLRRLADYVRRKA